MTSQGCYGCGRKLEVENAWMCDGCPCNSRLGVNSQNETRWQLLIELQQRQSRQMEVLRKSIEDIGRHYAALRIGDGTTTLGDFCNRTLDAAEQQQ